jgi:uncharacterized protein YfkK (UPF0435 family)
MILNNAPQNEAILSNVGEIGEFRIRNSAKAFNILSSGLYANKIRAIIRELSCNAVDSHTAAGKADVQFDVHLPNSLEPHFSIRDFGTGLTHEQVTNIYTTYFESTKTDSNAFIGALGLGSKSPFSYTDNFTVTAIKDGRKGIYSAFINGEGVPSIALMMSEDTDEPAGVEIKFSVNDRFDYQKFRDEAASVYLYFKLKPKVTGVTNFTLPLIEYDTQNLIQGVHVRKDTYRNRSVAVMGNIAYPVDVPNPEQLGSLRSMLECGLEMHFGIGELDFQASREGLSYIPQTVDSIKKKLEDINSALTDRIKTDAEQVTNLWDRAVFLHKKREHPLWMSAVDKYVVDSKLETAAVGGGRYNFLKTFKVTLDDMRDKYNIAVRAFDRNRGSTTCSNVKHSTEHVRDANGSYSHVYSWEFAVRPDSDFIINDTKVGACERAKYHYRETEMKTYHRTVYVLDKADPLKDMNTEQFFLDICSPPEDRILCASDLKQKPRKDSSVGRNVSILGMERRTRGYRSEQYVWVDAGKLSDFDSNKTHYYVPLSGYTIISDSGITDAKELREILKESGLGAFQNVVIYGVRKTDLETVKSQSNWVNVESFIQKTLTVPDHNVVMNMVCNTIGMFDFMGNRYGDTFKFNHNLVKDGSPFKNFVKKYDGYKRVSFSETALRKVYSAYGKNINFDVSTAVQAITDEFASVKERYPLLDNIGNGAAANAIAEYVNLIDNVKGI